MLTNVWHGWVWLTFITVCWLCVSFDHFSMCYVIDFDKCLIKKAYRTNRLLPKIHRGMPYMPNKSGLFQGKMTNF